MEARAEVGMSGEGEEIEARQERKYSAYFKYQKLNERI